MIDTAYFYPRSPCGERLFRISNLRSITIISIHALLAESDRISLDGVGVILISIHALLAESDLRDLCDDMYLVISIHALLVESDLMRPYAYLAKLGFLSTLSLRRATAQTAGRMGLRGISIHALLAESDGDIAVRQAILDDFYPRSPCGERPVGTRQSENPR